MTEIQIEYQFLIIVVEGFYTPEEPTTSYGDDLGGYPGSPAEFEINKVYLLNDEDKQDLLNILNQEQVKEIENIVLKMV